MHILSRRRSYGYIGRGVEGQGQQSEDGSTGAHGQTLDISTRQVSAAPLDIQNHNCSGLTPPSKPIHTFNRMTFIIMVFQKTSEAIEDKLTEMFSSCMSPQYTSTNIMIRSNSGWKQ